MIFTVIVSFAVLVNNTKNFLETYLFPLTPRGILAAGVKLFSQGCSTSKHCQLWGTPKRKGSALNTAIMIKIMNDRTSLYMLLPPNRSFGKQPYTFLASRH